MWSLIAGRTKNMFYHCAGAYIFIDSQAVTGVSETGMALDLARFNKIAIQDGSRQGSY